MKLTSLPGFATPLRVAPWSRQGQKSIVPAESRRAAYLAPRYAQGGEVDTEPINVLYRLKRGLSAYISYLAACEMNQAFSEYVLYEPMLRILTAHGYNS